MNWEESFENVPALHLSHSMLAVLFEKVPGLQAWHFIWPVWLNEKI